MGANSRRVTAKHSLLNPKVKQLMLRCPFWEHPIKHKTILLRPRLAHHRAKLDSLQVLIIGNDGFSSMAIFYRVLGTEAVTNQVAWVSRVESEGVCRRTVRTCRQTTLMLLEDILTVDPLVYGYEHSRSWRCVRPTRKRMRITRDRVRVLVGSLLGRKIKRQGVNE